MANEVDISGLGKAEVLQALYNGSRPMGMGMFRAVMLGNESIFMTLEEAEKALETGDDHEQDFGSFRGGKIYFDYLNGRPLKVDLSGDSFDPWGYDRDNGGDGTAARIIQNLREMNALG